MKVASANILFLFSDTVFTNFTIGCGGDRDVIIMDHPDNNIGVQHPIRVQNIILENVDVESKLFFSRQSIRYVPCLLFHKKITVYTYAHIGHMFEYSLVS